ncbi:serine-rich adhesin for platelets-like [Haliotis rufescens]|uniref:serine-rich adhesin for platelets-like n=1 Tax=Haliotis rufescens TaxID=6454 RepID=UPI00201F6455|nr:serine-rich adhesin for platelets-like [Haliotis rufescens]
MAARITGVLFLCCVVLSCGLPVDTSHSRALGNKRHDVNKESNTKKLAPGSPPRTEGIYDVFGRSNSPPRTEGIYDVFGRSNSPPRTEGIYDVFGRSNSPPRTEGIYDVFGRSNTNPGTRRFHRSSGLDIYSHLAALSGGSVIGSNKTDVEHASSITVAEAALASPVVVMVTRVNATPPRDVTFNVDSALTLILVEVTGHITKSAIQLSDPKGAAVGKVTLAVDSAGALVYKIVKPSPGSWKLHFSDMLHYDVIVKGDSDVSFQAQFMMLNPDTGYAISVPGDPPAGINLTLAIEINGVDKTQNITAVTLYALNGDVIKSAVLTPVGRTGARYKAAINLPAKDLRLGISGIDNHGNSFTRMSETAVSPESEFKVTFNITAGESSTSGTGGVHLPFVVTNYGVPGSFSVQVTSTNTVLKPVVSPNSFTVMKGHSYTGTVTVTANITAPSTAGDVVLTVTAPSGVSDYVTTPVIIYSRPTASAVSTRMTSTSSETTPPTAAAVSVVTKEGSMLGSRTPSSVTKGPSASTLAASTGRTASTQLPGYTSPLSSTTLGSMASISSGLHPTTASMSSQRPRSTEPSRVPESKATTSGGIAGFTDSMSTEALGPTTTTSDGLSGSTANTAKGLLGSTTSTPKGLPGSTTSTAKELPGSTTSTSKGLPGSTTSTSKELPGSTISTSKELTGSTTSTSKELPGSTTSTSKELTGSTTSTSKGLSGSTTSTSKELTGSTTSTAKELPGSTTSTSKELTGSTTSTSKELTGSTTSTSKELSGSTAFTPKYLGSTTSTSKYLGSTTSTSKYLGSTASTSEGLPTMKPAIIASIVCGCVAAVAGVGLCVLILTKRGWPRSHSDKANHYMDSGQYSNSSIDKATYNAGYEMDSYQPHKD